MRLCFAVVLSMLVLIGSAPAQDAAGKVSFSRDIRPILSDACFQCHGPDKNQRKGELRLDVKDDVFKDRGGYSVVVPGKLDDSELYRRLTETDPTAKMPPPKSARQLTPNEIDLIKRWISQGGEWQGHWAYVLPEKPQVPQVPDRSAFIKNDIDRFVMHRLQERGLRPAPEADRVTLIRRLNFDLTGLPPTPKEVADFVKDSSSEAYEKVVDRLLASPYFGERMAMFWLDLVRYADTNGYHSDIHEDHDLYRDWVIQAFNDNMPFDRFTIHQLAGDLLPEPSQEMRIASGYNRLIMTTEEGGAQPKEYLAKYSADRVRNFSSVWLAGTMACCECHDHKYDPFTTRDFYSLAAFFADIPDTPVGKQKPTRFPTPDQSARLVALDAQIAPLKAYLETPTPELEAAQAEWEASLRGTNAEWTVLKPAELKSSEGTIFRPDAEGLIVATGPSPDRDTYVVEFRAVPRGITALRLEVLPNDALPEKGPGRSEDGNFVLNEISATIDGKPVEWSAATATHSQTDWDIAGAIDGDEKTGWAIRDQTGKPSQAYFELKTDVAGDDGSTLILTLRQSFGFQHTIGRLRVSATSAPRPVRAPRVANVARAIAAILKIEPAQRSDKQKQELWAHFRTTVPALEAPRKELAELQRQRDEIDKNVRTTIVTMAAEPRPIRVLPRGNWLDDSGDIVTPAPPAFLSLQAAPAESARLSRRDLANWLVSPENPLTARVFVNRLWKIAFGQGLSKSVEDFGAQGVPPTHPDLLDWLALEFRNPDTANRQPVSPWDVKRILKLLVMSGTYRQSSHADESLRHKDPYNLWLARQGRYRFDAETVRDNALAVSGLLVHRLGGTSSKPYQPAGYWSYLNFPVREWYADKGDGLYRRGLYTYWCRTFLQPSLKAFDAPTREECTADRPRSNTPLQALVLLNDPTYVETARVFAERIVREGGATPESRLQFAFLEAVSRPPRADEAKLLSQLLEKHLSEYRADGKAAEAILNVGDKPASTDLNAAELAAWTSVARVIFNLHEVVTRN